MEDKCVNCGSPYPGNVKSGDGCLYCGSRIVLKESYKKESREIYQTPSNQVDYGSVKKKNKTVKKFLIIIGLFYACYYLFIFVLPLIGSDFKVSNLFSSETYDQKYDAAKGGIDLIISDVKKELGEDVSLASISFFNGLKDPYSDYSFMTYSHFTHIEDDGIWYLTRYQIPKKNSKDGKYSREEALSGEAHNKYRNEDLKLSDVDSKSIENSFETIKASMQFDYERVFIESVDYRSVDKLDGKVSYTITVAYTVDEKTDSSDKIVYYSMLFAVDANNQIKGDASTFNKGTCTKTIDTYLCIDRSTQQKPNFSGIEMN